MRSLNARGLRSRGYSVIEASNGIEAMEALEEKNGAVDLVVSDVVMPELGGRELAEAVVRLRPRIKVIFMSGHTQDVVVRAGVQKGAAFQQKPFTPAGLAGKVRETLDGGGEAWAPHDETTATS